MAYMSPTKIKKMSLAYDSLMDSNEYKLADAVAKVMFKSGYIPKITRDKYKFVFRK